jgi:GH43 family beta-xylosidase
MTSEVLDVLLNSEISEDDFVCKCGAEEWMKEVLIRNGKALITYRCSVCSREYGLVLSEKVNENKNAFDDMRY